MALTRTCQCINCYGNLSGRCRARRRATINVIYLANTLGGKWHAIASIVRTLREVFWKANAYLALVHGKEESTAEGSELAKELIVLIQAAIVDRLGYLVCAVKDGFVVRPNEEYPGDGIEQKTDDDLMSYYMKNAKAEELLRSLKGFNKGFLARGSEFDKLLFELKVPEEKVAELLHGPAKGTTKTSSEATKGEISMTTPPAIKGAPKSDEQLALEAAEKRKDVTIVRTGDRIILPQDMTYDEGVHWLNLKKQDEEQVVGIMERVDAYPFDGAYAFSKALERRFGFTSMKAESFWDQPPAYIAVEVGLGQTVQVPWGTMRIPGVSGKIDCGITKLPNGTFVFQIEASVKKKDAYIIKEIAQSTKDIVARESIYRGKAIRLTFTDPDPMARFNPNDTPKFIDLRKVNEEELIFPADIDRVVRSTIFTPIEKTAVALKNKINLKRGVLLAGKPGVGKTLTAFVTAKKAVDNHWTFIYLDSVKSLQQGIYFAQQYGPAIIFAEDIDRVTNERDDAMNQILNVVDGIDTKTGQTMIVLTTNDLDSIEPVMLRPGRIDTVIDIPPPDAKSAEKLIRVYAKDEAGNSILKVGEDLTEVGLKLSGMIPAVIAEVVAKSKLTALNHLELEDTMELTKDDLLTAAIAMVEHIKLLDRPEKVEQSDVELFGNVVGYHIVRGVTDAREKVSSEFVNKYLKQLKAEAKRNGVEFVSAGQVKNLPENTDPVQQ